ncbi:hypothetical protein G6045_39900 [Streptomyces sp. YC504]|uniref:Tetratricopeptide repeat protein n=1 Tax=Streptomyces mesophilus TaxID=1775132 RepID=A0A6G4XWE4_9ACTN|nr:hypothetical protein [Streptomyces mesophilus]NGO81768.1 hypothetical protein [Streptomyces mesophilus]
MARARELRDQGHPQAPLAWERVAEALGTEEPDSAFLAAELLEHRAVAAAKAGAPDAGALLRSCRDAHRDAGHDARTALMELHLAVHAAASGDSPDAVRTQLEAAMRAARELWSNAWWERRTAQASLTNIRVQAHLRRQTASPEATGLPTSPEATALSGDTPPGSGPGGTLSTVDRQYQGALMEFVATTPDVPPTHEGVTAASLCDLIAEAEGELAQLALEEGDTQRADELLASAATRVLAADRPWDAAHPLAVRAGLLAALGRPDEAEQCARAALDAAELTAPEQQGTVRLTLVDVLLRRDQAEEAVEHAIDAAHWFDQAGLEAEGGAEARRLLAEAYRAQGRTPEAAEVLQSALPDLIRRGPEAEVRARATLAELLRGLREPRAAAEQLLRAADICKDWDDPRPQARLALDAADCLQAAGLDEAADAAYGRALELWRACGDAAGEARVLRALAWRRFRGDGDEDAEYGSPEGLALARPLFDRALAVLDEAADPELRFEHALTLDQYADMLGEYLEELGSTRDDEPESTPDDEPESTPDEEPDPAPDKELVRSVLDLYAHAAEEYGALGAAHLSDRFEALHSRVWLAREHLPAAEAVALATELIDELRAHGSLDAHRRADHLEKSRNTWRKG